MEFTVHAVVGEGSGLVVHGACSDRTDALSGGGGFVARVGLIVVSSQP